MLLQGYLYVIQLWCVITHGTETINLILSLGYIQTLWILIIFAAIYPVLQ